MTVQRYYASLREDKTYKKRVTYLWEGGLKSKFAFVEYVGKFPGLSANGNSQDTENEYVRTPVYVMDEMKQLLQTQQPRTVYNTLKRKYDELSRPTGLEQIRNKRRTEKNKEENACNGHNVADQILVVENMIRSLGRLLGTKTKHLVSFCIQMNRSRI